MAACLERIAEREPEVRAWAHLDPEAALAQARERDARAAARAAARRAGRRQGHHRHRRTCRRSAARRPRRAAPGRATPTCVTRLRDAGAVVLGKTVTTELATYQPSVTRNPADPARTPGGSSSGSAAAVADAMVPLALGSQTAGSVVRPAAYCGVLGLKPTHGAIDLTGVLAAQRAARHARRVRPRPPTTSNWRSTSSPTRPRRRRPRAAVVRVARTPWWERADEDGRAARRGGRRAPGARPARASARSSCPPSFAPLPEAHDRLMAHDVARTLALGARAPRATRSASVLRGYRERGRGDRRRRGRRVAARGAAAGPRLEGLLDPGRGAARPRGRPASRRRAAEGSTGDPLFCRAVDAARRPGARRPRTGDAADGPARRRPARRPARAPSARCCAPARGRSPRLR